MNGSLIPTNGDAPIPLVKARILIGRQPSCDIQLPFANVSSRHAELRFDKGSWLLVDLQSSNGTKVNDEKIVRKRLRPRDHITFARKHHFRIEYVPEGKFPPGDEDDVLVSKKTDAQSVDVFAQSLLERAGLQKKSDDDGLGSDVFEDDSAPRRPSLGN